MSRIALFRALCVKGGTHPIYQAMKYLSLDIADFIEKGPQLVELPSV